MILDDLNDLDDYSDDYSDDYGGDVDDDYDDSCADILIQQWIQLENYLKYLKQ